MEELTFYGTELEGISDEEGAVSRRPLNVQEQTVTDERGRRRFHGAFTGGFSAGYFNTVGSKEGWQPTQYCSSRDARNQFVTSKPEDFMDEEDLGEFGIAARKIHAVLDDKHGTNRFAWEHQIGSFLGNSLASALESVIRPVSDSVGTRLLRKMGWRGGQGIGPKRTKRVAEKLKANEHRIHGSETGVNLEAVEEAEDMAPGFLFAPEDISFSTLHSHEGTHGLGYEGLKKRDVFSEQYGTLETALKTKAKSQGIRGQAFGVGAFEDDDANIYTNYDLSQYDFAIGKDDETSYQHQSDSSSFVMSSKRCYPTRYPDPPRVPPNFRPTHTPVFFDFTAVPESVKKLGEKMTPLQRAKYLGEVDKNVVIELIRDEDRKRLKSRWSVAKEQSTDIDENLFEEEPMKQARFKQYVNYLKRGLSLPQPSEMTSLEWERELNDFNSALPPYLRALLPGVKSRQLPLAPVELSLPVAQALKMKFMPSSMNEGKKKESGDEDLLSAVKMKMFGEITRQMFEWHPCKQMVKRFNVPDPYPSSNLIGVPHLQKTVKRENLLNLGSTAEELKFRDERIKQSGVDTVNSEVSAGIDTVKLGTTTETSIEKVPDDLLKVIFEESDEGTQSSSSDEEVGKDKTDQFVFEASPSVVSNEEEKFVNVMDIIPDDEEFGPAPPPTLRECHGSLPLTTVQNSNGSERGDQKEKRHKTRNKRKHSNIKKHKKRKHSRKKGYRNRSSSTESERIHHRRKHKRKETSRHE